MLRGRTRNPVVIVLLVTITVGWLSPPQAWGTDNVRHPDTLMVWHWPQRNPTSAYQMNFDVPDSWWSQIWFSSSIWGWGTAEFGTEVSIDFGGLTDSTSWSTTSTHLVLARSIPASWQGQNGCDTDLSLACTRKLGSNTHGDHVHIVDVDMIFNTAVHDFTTDYNSCLLGTNDVGSLALHEFGHWIGLHHTVDPAAVMYAPYIGLGCQKRGLTNHDKASAVALYSGAF